jgi:hypothetical protein
MFYSHNFNKVKGDVSKKYLEDQWNYLFRDELGAFDFYKYKAEQIDLERKGFFKINKVHYKNKCWNWQYPKQLETTKAIEKTKCSESALIAFMKSFIILYSPLIIYLVEKRKANNQIITELTTETTVKLLKPPD